MTLALLHFSGSNAHLWKQEVESDSRGAFSTVEASAQNFFELFSYASTIIFSRPDQFQWPVLISASAVVAAGGLYTAYVRKRRGHLLHRPPCLRMKGGPSANITL